MKTILVPLDGSEHSDQALPLIRCLLLDAEREVYLLRVVPPFVAPPGEQEELPGRDDPHLSLRVDAARRHLEGLTDQLEAHGVEVTSEVFLGDPTETILLTANRIGASMIAMVTHGRSGILRWIQGSVAEGVLRNSSVPLLLFNPDEAGVRPPGLPLFGRILVALDGSERSAAVLPHVVDLATQFKADVTLFRCLGSIAPGMTPSVPMAMPYVAPYAGLSEDAAGEELEPHRQTLARSGISTRIRVERGTNEASQILAAAEAEDADLIAMTTHGNSGIDRMLFGSVTEAVLRRSSRPMLIVRSCATKQQGADERSPERNLAHQS